SFSEAVLYPAMRKLPFPIRSAREIPPPIRIVSRITILSVIYSAPPLFSFFSITSHMTAVFFIRRLYPSIFFRCIGDKDHCLKPFLLICYGTVPFIWFYGFTYVFQP